MLDQSLADCPGMVKAWGCVEGWVTGGGAWRPLEDASIQAESFSLSWKLSEEHLL